MDETRDPSVGPDGIDLSLCYGLREALDEIDERFASMDRNEREGQGLRDCILDVVDVIGRLSGRHSYVLAQLGEAVMLAGSGLVHPAFATATGQPRPRALLTALRVQATSAALLEYAFTDLKKRQDQSAREIADYLLSLGFVQPNDGSFYSSSSVVKWRQACILGKHKAVKIYSETLTDLRSKQCGFALGWLKLILRPEEFLHQKPGRKTTP